MRTLLLTSLCVGLLAFTGCQSMKSGCADGGCAMPGCASGGGDPCCADGSCGNCGSCQSGLLGNLRSRGGGGGCKACGVKGCKGQCRGGMLGGGGMRGGGGGGGLRNAICGTCGVNGCDGRCNKGLRGRLGYATSNGPAPVGHVPPDSRRVRGGREIINGAAGPPSATYTYPYYTTRGPRDYFDSNPPSIGY